MDPLQFPEDRVAAMIAKIVEYFRQERALYQPCKRSTCARLEVQHAGSFLRIPARQPSKPSTLNGARIPPLPFYSEAVAMSAGHFPDFVHLASVTYIDVIVFNDAIAPRTWFHGLVHAQQMASLGLENYAGLYLRVF